VTVCRYVERNALSAGLVARAQDWPWCSLAARVSSNMPVPLVSTAFLASNAWIDYVNAVLTVRERMRAGSSVPEMAETVEKSYDPIEAKSVEKSSDPLRDRPSDPRPVELAQQRGDVRRRGDQNEADAHVERAEHLGIVNAAGLLEPLKERRHAPAVAIE
jgi:hypothetical protein